jgi:hypothetical protein
MFIVPIIELIFTALPRVKAQGQTLKMFTAAPRASPSSALSYR